MEQVYMGAGANIDKGENARLNSIVGAIAIADLVKTTLGPKGLDKILQRIDPNDQSISITNDGATILRSLTIDNAAAKVLVDIAKVQDDEIGDGTTSVAVLCGELLREAEMLMDGSHQGGRLHPQTLCSGWRMAKQIALDALKHHAECFTKAMNVTEDVEVLRPILMNLAKTTLSSKVVTYDKEMFASLAVDAILRLKNCNYDLHYIQILKKPGGSIRDSYLDEGFLLDKSIGIGQPTRIENAKIVLANTSMDTDKIKIYGSRVRVNSLSKVAEIEQAEKIKMKNKVEKIINNFDVNVFINRQLIYNFPESLFAQNNIMSIEHADFDGIERLAAVTGGQILSTFDHPELAVLGECDLIEEVMIGEDKLIKFSGCKVNEACTVVLRGSSTHMLEEMERSLHDALCILQTVLKSDNLFQIICGGGCTEILMGQAIDDIAPSIAGKRSVAMTAYANALRTLPRIVADNGGYDSTELVTQLRAAHSQSKNKSRDVDKNADTTTAYHGLDMYNGEIANMKELGVYESYRSKMQVVISATEAAEMILRVDDIVTCAPRERSQHY